MVAVVAAAAPPQGVGGGLGGRGEAVCGDGGAPGCGGRP